MVAIFRPSLVVCLRLPSFSICSIPAPNESPPLLLHLSRICGVYNYGPIRHFRLAVLEKSGSSYRFNSPSSYSYRRSTDVLRGRDFSPGQEQVDARKVRLATFLALLAPSRPYVGRSIF